MFNIADPDKLNLLQVLSVRLNFALYAVSPERQGCRIRDLLSRRGDSAPSSKPFRDEMLVLDGLSHPDLNFLLNELIRTGHPVRLKALVTPTNQEWTALALHGQLLAEDSMHHGKR